MARLRIEQEIRIGQKRDRPADARARDQGRLAAASRQPRTTIADNAGGAGAGSCSIVTSAPPAGPEVVRRHHLRADPRGLAVPRRRDGLLQPQDRRLVDARQPRGRAGRRRDRDERRPPPARSRGSIHHTDQRARNTPRCCVGKTLRDVRHPAPAWARSVTPGTTPCWSPRSAPSRPSSSTGTSSYPATRPGSRSVRLHRELLQPAPRPQQRSAMLSPDEYEHQYHHNKPQPEKPPKPVSTETGSRSLLMASRSSGARWTSSMAARPGVPVGRSPIVGGDDDGVGKRFSASVHGGVQA